MNVTITLGGLLVGLGLLLRQFLPSVWAVVMKGKAARFPRDSEGPAGGGKFNIREHVPFLIGSTVGMLAISCPGGFLGMGAAKILGISDVAGDKVLAGGVGGSTTAVTRHAANTMDQYGAMVTLLLVIAVVILRKALDKRAKGQLFSGVWCGSTLGLSAGAAGLTAAVLIPVAEQLGHFLGGQA